MTFPFHPQNRLAALALLVLLAGCGQAPQQISSAPPGINVGRAALDGGVADVALQVASTILAHSPNDPQALLLRADALATEGKTGEATATYRQVIALDPKSVPARLGLGRGLLAENAAAAEAMFAAVLETDPGNAAAANNLGIARDLQNHHEQAQDAYRHALALAPSMQAAAVNLALSLGLSGQTEAAIPLLRPIAQSPSAPPRVRQDLAAVLAMAGDRPAAQAMLSADMSAPDVQTALDVFTALRAAPPRTTSGL